MIEHMLKSTDPGFLISCIYCGSSLKERESEFYLDFHYKRVSCPECGKIHRHTVDFKGSGHDSWNDDNISVLLKD